jgi:hypothetical protein
MCYKRIENVIRSIEDVVLLIVYGGDSPCFSTTKLFEKMEEGRFLSVQIFIPVSV